MSVLFVLGFSASFASAAGPAAIDLGSIATNNFVVLGETGITDVPASVITGNIGNSSGSGAQIGVTCPEITGSIYTVDALTDFAGGPGGSADNTCVMAGTDGLGANKTLVDNAVADMGTAYTNASDPATPAGVGANLNIGTPAGTVGTMTLAPGVYTWNGPVTITNDITLSGGANDVWVFQISGTLDLAAGKSIILSGGAQAKNVFWRVADTVNLLAGSHMEGIILAQTNIAFRSGATLEGRALAQTAVTLIANTIGGTVTGAPVIPPVVSTRHHETIITPVIGILKVPTPLALPSGTGSVTYNYTVWNVGGQQALQDVSVVDDKCAPVKLVSGDTNNNGFLDPSEKWNYTCTMTLQNTTTNTAIATGYSSDGYHNTAIATAISTVVVTPLAATTPVAALAAPLINVVEVPNILTALPYGGGQISYAYTVTNPGLVPVHDVILIDDKCSPISRPAGDINGNGLLDPGETWTYTCTTNVPVSTASVATVKGDGNNFPVLAYAFTNVLVGTPGLPNTGFPADGNNSWAVIILSTLLAIVSVSLIVVLKKQKRS